VLEVVVEGSIRNGATSNVTLDGLDWAFSGLVRAVNPNKAEISPAIILGAVKVINQIPFIGCFPP
jgi:hypothetical protein